MAFQIEVSADGQKRFTFVSQRCLGMNGVRAEVLLADPARFYDMIVPDHREAFARAEAAAMAAFEPFDIEVAMRRADGEVRWRRIAATPRSPLDGVTLWDGVQIDVTESRAMAAELEEQRRRVEVAVEAAGLGLWEHDIRSGRISWSDRIRDIFGVGDQVEITSEVYLGLVHPDDFERVTATYQGLRESGAATDLAMEYRIVRPDGGVRSILACGRMIHDEFGPRRLVGTILDVTDRKAEDERRALLMGELAHRLKNGITVIMGMVSQSARGQETVEGFQEVLLSRLQAMAASQELITAASGRSLELVNVIRKTLEPFGLSRIEVDEALEGVLIRGQLPTRLGLLLHELATNASKYGALSNSKGRVAIGRGEAPAGRLTIEWREQGGPPVAPPQRRGFGTRLLQQALAPEGRVTFEFEPSGFRARVECSMVEA